MTHLRKMMLEELERRNYTAEYHARLPAHHRGFRALLPPSARPTRPGTHPRVQAYLFRDRKLTDNTVNQRVGALRFFYRQDAEADRGAWTRRRTRRRVLHLPVILSREEVARLIESAPTPFHRTILMTLYATGVRRAELAHLKITDIDSQRMVIHVQGGKGRKDRDVMLSPNLLEELRAALSQADPETGRVAVPRRPLAHRRSSDHHQGRLARLPRSRQARRHPQSSFIRTPCGTASPLTCWKPAPTCAPSRFCWAIAIWKRPPSISTCRSGISAPPPARWMRCRSSPQRAIRPVRSRCRGHPSRWPM